MFLVVNPVMFLVVLAIVVLAIVVNPVVVNPVIVTNLVAKGERIKSWVNLSCLLGFVIDFASDTPLVATGV